MIPENREVKEYFFSERALNCNGSSDRIQPSSGCIPAVKWSKCPRIIQEDHCLSLSIRYPDNAWTFVSNVTFYFLVSPQNCFVQYSSYGDIFGRFSHASDMWLARSRLSPGKNPKMRTLVFMSQKISVCNPILHNNVRQQHPFLGRLVILESHQSRQTVRSENSSVSILPPSSLSGHRCLQ